MQYLIDRLKEPSTWRGIIMVATGIGASWSPQSQELIVSVGVSLAGVVGALLPDSWKK